ncbi:LPS export ABC transporter periplasmic protein LptC [Reinekea marina]|uniref:LPS export ABC transporter periplasmic protein LptC n=1 Tax=Reinekea marina TaxID=1310421 RepID=A0ABV7WNT8_9GAMM|nr:LPS export ABC transporter periplasmic protein LptC [Reinekea marina]MDN3648732.1 LPS export ABC transporter periplasmic protein LptC [Reinekea marina]
MVQSRPIIPILIAIAAASLLYLLQEDDIQPSEEQSIVLPEGSPDIYMTGVDITRYDEQGQATLHAKGESLTVFNDPKRTVFAQPIIHLIDQEQRTWRITSSIAFIDENDNIDFQENVVATQLISSPPLILRTEQLLVDPAKNALKSDLAVQVTQGQQRIKAIGMTAELDTMGTNIHFLSEVSFVYEP